MTGNSGPNGSSSAFAPAGTPREIVALLSPELQKAAASPETRQKLSDIGLETVTSSPEELRDMVQREQARCKEVTRVAQVKVKVKVN